MVFTKKGTVISTHHPAHGCLQHLFITANIGKQTRYPSVVEVQFLSHVWLQPHGLWHARLLCPSLSRRVCSNSRPLSQWCYLTISSSISPFSLCLQSFPVSGSFPMSWLLASGGQSIGALATVLPMNIKDWFSLGFPGLIALKYKGFKNLLQHHNLKATFL